MAMGVDAEIRFALYVVFFVTSIEAAAWCGLIAVRRDAPRVALPMCASMIALAGACLALAAAQGLQTWNMDAYFDYVDYIRWCLLFAISVGLASHHWWRWGRR